MSRCITVVSWNPWYGLVSSESLTLNQHSCHDINLHQDELWVLIANVVDVFDAVDPARILTKAKLHVLVHLPKDVKWFGPPIRYATEIFECFNHVFHMCSVLSNQASGCDIARKCASMERVKHIMGGGYWGLDHEHWVQASPHVWQLLQTHPIVQTHLRWAFVNKSLGMSSFNQSIKDKQIPGQTLLVDMHVYSQRLHLCLILRGIMHHG